MEIVVCDAPSDYNKNNLHNRFMFVLDDDEIRILLDDGFEGGHLDAFALRPQDFKCAKDDYVFTGFFLGRKAKDK